MPWIDTSTLQPGVRHPDNDQLYNGLDCCLTVEIFEEIVRARPDIPLIYSFSRALQAPALAMMRRGFRIDEYERQKGLDALRNLREELDADLQLLAMAVWDRELNPGSSKQLQSFFYKTMGLPEQFAFTKGVRRVSANRESLEKLDLYLYARPFINLILAIRDIDEQVKDFEQTLEGGRYYTSFNIAGTETWRFSSSKSARGTSGNIQNKKRDDDLWIKCPSCRDTEPGKLTCSACNASGKVPSGELSLRRPFIADPGWKLCEIDLEQAESREVGWLCFVLFGDPTYLDATESTDLHTTVVRMTWPELAWNGEPKHDRTLADSPFYRNSSHRDMAKRLGHGSNYGGQPPTMALRAKIPTKMAQAFQARYFEAFPSIPRWHRYVAQELQLRQRIVNSFGVERTFFGRPNDDATLREAIAHGPQSSTAMRTNLGMWRIWHSIPEVELRAQKHDSITFQFPDSSDEYETVVQALHWMSTRLHHNGRMFDVPCEAKVGWNWGTYDSKLNPNGMKKWNSREADTRKRLDGLERPL
jgi:DNA polymerase I-like protein with 3'-5' exonuclease and polymerase domains